LNIPAQKLTFLINVDNPAGSHRFSTLGLFIVVFEQEVHRYSPLFSEINDEKQAILRL